MPIFRKHFTVAEARAALPALRRRLLRVQALLAEARRTQTMNGAAQTVVMRGNGKGPILSGAGQPKEEAQRLIEEIAEEGVQIKDLERGLVDFPHFLHGDPAREVYLCWHLGEDTIGYWHEIEAGFGGRTPLDQTFARQIKDEAARLGFALCGITMATPPPHHRKYVQWLAEGQAGEMLYLHRQEPKRGNLQQILPGARSVVCVALNYSAETTPAENPSGLPEAHHPPATGGRGEVQEKGQKKSPNLLSLPDPVGSSAASLPATIARYARFDDYHETLWRRLTDLLAFIQAQEPKANGKVYCDTGPITERDLAMRAGLGWIGKHTNLISRHLGNWFFLGEIILDITLPPDLPETTHCGTCTRCLPACPTGAITAPYQLDARQCISYLTIELKGSIPEDLRPLIGTRIYGCDDCLAVCPWNKFAVRSDDPAVRPRADLTTPDLLELLALDDAGFRAKFQNSPIKRAKRRGLLRNVCIALGNLGDPRALPALEHAAEHDPEPLVREHAAWAIRQFPSAK